MRKGAVSFGTIVAIIGSVLIGCGVAWLLAENWHAMPDALKTGILLVLTSASFVAAIMLRDKGYPGTAKSLFVLGSLLYTLSIFLIAQIYSTSASIQGTAWLLLLCWIGVIATAYVFDSWQNLLIGLVEFLIWISLQIVAIQRDDTVIALIALTYLSAAALFYGLNLLHQAKNHAFAKTYFFFTALYLLIFAYIMSFQVVLPVLWSMGKLTTAGITFAAVLGGLAVAAMAAGIIQQRPPKQELAGIIALLLLLLVLIGAAHAIKDTTGSCYAKQCYDFDARDTCQGAPSDLRCEWVGRGMSSYCQERNCYSMQNQSSCDQAADLQCKWTGYGCTVDSCGLYQTKDLCSNATAALNCTWKEYSPGFSSCAGSADAYQQKQIYDNNVCSTYNNQHDACNENPACQWRPGYDFIFGEERMPTSVWMLWIIANLVLLGTILGVIFYGTWKGIPSLVNLGIVFFALMIATRYIGFIIDLGNYVTLSVIFITGGLLLLIGGWGIERWRRKLVQQAKEGTTAPVAEVQPAQKPREKPVSQQPAAAKPTEMTAKKPDPKVKK
jgi:uncharacterized membrane protein